MWNKVNFNNVNEARTAEKQMLSIIISGFLVFGVCAPLIRAKCNLLTIGNQTILDYMGVLSNVDDINATDGLTNGGILVFNVDGRLSTVTVTNFMFVCFGIWILIMGWFSTVERIVDILDCPFEDDEETITEKDE